MEETPKTTGEFKRIPTPAARKLAERYGITPEAVEEIISGTALEYTSVSPSITAAAPHASTATQSEPVRGDGNSQTFASLTLPPVVTNQVPIEKAAAAEPPLRKIPLEDPARKTPSTSTTSTSKTTSPINGGVITAIVVSLGILLAIWISFERGCFRQRNQSGLATPPDTVQTMLSDAAKTAGEPPVQPSNVTPPQVPAEALATPHELSSSTPKPTQPQPTGAQKRRTSSGRKSSRPTSTLKPAAVTSSNLEAQEKLAELRASGHKKAHITTAIKNGQRIYRVIR